MKLFQSFFKSEPGATLEESLDDCRIVGVCDISRHEFDLPTHALAPDYALYLTALAVHPALRRRGVASSLLEAVDAHARSEKLEQVILHVEDDNDAAIEACRLEIESALHQLHARAFAHFGQTPLPELSRWSTEDDETNAHP